MTESEMSFDGLLGELGLAYNNNDADDQLERIVELKKAVLERYEQVVAGFEEAQLQLMKEIERGARAEGVLIERAAGLRVESKKLRVRVEQLEAVIRKLIPYQDLCNEAALLEILHGATCEKCWRCGSELHRQDRGGVVRLLCWECHSSYLLIMPAIPGIKATRDKAPQCSTCEVYAAGVESIAEASEPTLGMKCACNPDGLIGSPDFRCDTPNLYVAITPTKEDVERCGCGGHIASGGFQDDGRAEMDMCLDCGTTLAPRAAQPAKVVKQQRCENCGRSIPGEGYPGCHSLEACWESPDGTRSLWRPIQLKEISIEVFQQDWIPGFAAYLDDGSLKEGAPAHVVLNLGSTLAVVEQGGIEKDEVPYFVAENIMHEVIHVLEAWANVEFNEDRVEQLIEKYREEQWRSTT